MTDDFDAIVAGLDLDVDTSNVRSVVDLADGELLMEYSRVKRDLLNSGQMISNHASEDVRDLQSRHSALSLEIKRRRLA